MTVSQVPYTCLEVLMIGQAAKREFVLSGRLEMIMLSSLRLGETTVGVVPSSLIMIVRLPPLSTNILARNPIVVSQQGSHLVKRAVYCACHISDLFVIQLCGLDVLTVIPTCLLEIQVIVCGRNLQLSIMKPTDRRRNWRGCNTSQIS